jgi:hypothetical protein
MTKTPQLSNETALDGSPDKLCTSVPLPETENADMMAFAEEHRSEYQLSNEQELMIGCTWLLPEEKRLFCLFPEVIHIESISCTNREDHPLLTITYRDSRGKAFTVLRVFLLNKRTRFF